MGIFWKILNFIILKIIFINNIYICYMNNNQNNTKVLNNKTPKKNNNNKKKNNNKNKFNKTVISLIKNKDINLFKSEFTYEGGDGFQCVKVKLKPGNKLRADAGAMNYMDSNITIHTKTGNIGKAFGRVFSGSSFFYNIFENEGSEDAYINLAGVNPGNIGAFYIPKGKSLNLVSSSYICSTPNLDISTDINFGGFLTGYGVTFVHVSAKESPGILWASVFGNVIEKNIKPGDSLIVDNGVILAFNSDTKLNTTVMKGFTSMLFSGEGLVTKIKNDKSKNLKIFLQSRSKIAYLQYLKNTLSPSSKSTSISLFK